jgi:hypothetical protein
MEERDGETARLRHPLKETEAELEQQKGERAQQNKIATQRLEEVMRKGIQKDILIKKQAAVLMDVEGQLRQRESEVSYYIRLAEERDATIQGLKDGGRARCHDTRKT